MAELLARLQAALGDGFRIERELGGGGMSRVFLAEESRLGRRVVIKLLPPEAAEGIPADRFEREIKVAASLQHPHVVAVLSAGTADGLLYYIMPYIEGESLATRLAREGALPVGESIRILRDVADALAYAHERGIIHRDIKPDNIMLAGRHALVTDFGVAKAVSASLSRSTTLTTGGVTLGTPTYMAPEQAAADPHLDHRADIYALGVVAYEMLCGRPPFMAPTAQAMLAAHVTATPDPVNAHRATIPVEVSQIVMRCLEKHPADRWQGAAELGERLEIATTPSGGTPSVSTAPMPAIKMAAERSARRAHPVRVALWFALATVVVTGVAFALTRILGLADWVWIGALACMVAGFPVMLYTGRLERNRAVLRATGTFRYEAEPAHHRWFTWRRALWGGAISLGVLLVLTLGYGLSRRFGIGPGATLLSAGSLENADRLVLADFTNRTSDSTLSASLSEALRVDLGQSSVVRLVDPQEVGQTLQRMGRDPEAPMDEAVAREVAQRANAKAVVAGDVSSLGSGYVLTARLVGVDGSVLVPIRETAASDADLIPALNRLSKSLREKIGESLRTIRASEPLEQVTTSSLPALRLYTRAQQSFIAADYQTARELLIRAVQTDSTFAMAWRKLAVTISNMAGQPSEIRAAATAAYNHRDHLPPKERALAEAYYNTNVVYDPDQAARAYQRALDIDSLDPVALNNLGLLLNAAGRPEEAEPLLRRGLRHSTIPTLYDNLINSLAKQQKWAAADSIAAELRQARPGESYPAAIEASLAMRRRDLGTADSLLAPFADDRHANDQVTFLRSQIAESRGQLKLVDKLSERVAQNVLARGDNGLAADILLGVVDHDVLQLGRPDRARELYDSIAASPLIRNLAPENRPLWHMALLNMHLGRPAVVRQLKAEWEAANPPTGRRPWDTPFWASIVAGSEGRWQDAARAAIATNDSSHCSPCGWYYAAAAWDHASMPDSALKYYELAYTTPPSNLDTFEDDTYAPLALKRLGELYESRGNREKAVEYFGKFVTLWKDADPELQPQVKEVKQAMARLAGETPTR